jgi:phenylalanyl-tRNA synthetase alpha chain
VVFGLFSDPDHGYHAMQTLLDGVVSALAGRWCIPAETIRHRPLVAAADNYDKLGFDPTVVTTGTATQP